jgi:eukaryotic-like serine/threonine-protein kinase
MATNIPKKLGKYDVLDIVGRGGMGIVYKATDPGIGRVVAIKMVTGGFGDDPELLKRFYREAQSAGKLQHPNIVTIYDLGDQDSNPYMVMEYLEGESLESIITSRRSVPLEQKLNIVIQVCDALSYAHQHNVIHRDIKPANVMVLKDFTVKIVDFGIARIGNENVTRPGQLMGSIPYMSPEQIKDKAYVDSRTDIFSVGVVLYQLLTYSLPFDGKDIGAILLKIVHDPPPPLKTYLPAYPEELDHIIAHALAKNSEERYATADRLAVDLMRVQDELKRDTVTEYLLSVDNLIADSQWIQAKEKVLQILRIDRQNSRANELLRKVEQQIQTQKRSEQARQLRAQAEQAIGRNELGDALRYLDHAVELDSSSHELVKLRNLIVERKAKEDQLAALLQRAESARDSGELEEAQKAVVDALSLDRNNPEAQALNVIITREIAEQSKQKQVQGFLDEARNRIATRSFTAALDVLKKAELLAPNVPGIRELANLAASGQEQERRRKQLEAVYAEIEDALNRDNFALACSKAEEGLQLFPEDRGLLKFKKLAEKQRQASEKRAYVEAQIAVSRQLLDSANPEQSLVPLEQALERYPQEPMLLSMLSVAKESLARRREEQRKADCIQIAKDAIRRKAYTEAIEALEATRKEISSSDLDDLLQFAQEEAANYATRLKIDAAADQARQLIADEDYRSAIELLQATLAEAADEELSIILEDASRRLQEFNQRVQESISTAQRLLRLDRCGEAVRFLETQFEQCGQSPEFVALLEQARRDFKRIQSFSLTRENAREALSHDDFLGAAATLQEFRDKFGDTPDAGTLQKEIEAARTRAATAAMEKALPDVRLLLMVRSFDPAEGILDSLSQWSAYAAPALKEQYESLRTLVRNAKEQHAANERAEKLKQAQISDQATSSAEDSQEGVDAGDPMGPTAAMSRSQLKVVLGQVAQIGNHYQDNQKVQSAIQDFKRHLTQRIGALEEISAIAPIRDGETVSVPPPSNPQASVAPTKPVEPQSDLTLTQQYAESTSRGGDAIPEHTAGIKAVGKSVDSDQATRRQKKAVRSVVERAQDLLNRSQPALAAQILRQAAAQYAGQSEINDLLTLAESRTREQRILEIERQADTEAKEGHFEQALSTLEEGLHQFPEAEPLRKAWESISAAKERQTLLGELEQLESASSQARSLEGLSQLLNHAQAIASTNAEDEIASALERVRKAADSRGELISRLMAEINQVVESALTTQSIEEAEQLLAEAQRRAAAQLELDDLQEIMVRASAQVHGRRVEHDRICEELVSLSASISQAGGVTELDRIRQRAAQLRDRHSADATVTDRCGQIEVDVRSARAELLQIELNRLSEEQDAQSSKSQPSEIASHVRKLQELIKTFPESAQAHAMLLRAQESLERLERARHDAEARASAIDLEIKASTRLFESKQSAKALSAIEEAVAKYPESESLQSLLVKCRERIATEEEVQRRASARRAALQAAIDKGTELLQTNRFEEAAALLEVACTQWPDEKQLQKLLSTARKSANRQRVEQEKKAQALSQASEGPTRKPRKLLLISGVVASLLLAVLLVPKVIDLLTTPHLFVLNVESMPSGAEVDVDGRKCITPHCSFKLPTGGTYTVQADLKGYVSTSQSVTLRNDQTISLELAREQQPGPIIPTPEHSQPPALARLVVKGIRSDDQLFVDDVRVPVSGAPGTWDLTPGSHRLRLMAGTQELITDPRQFKPNATVQLARGDFRQPPPATSGEQSDWARIAKGGETAGLEEFLRHYPNSPFRGQAESKLEDLYWSRANSSGSIAAFQEYVARYSSPAGPHLSAALAAIARLEWESLRGTTDPFQVRKFLDQHPTGEYHDLAVTLLDDLIWGQAIGKDDTASIKGYLNSYPSGRHKDEAAKELARLAPAPAPLPPPPAPSTAVPRVADHTDSLGDLNAIRGVLESYRSAYDTKDLAKLQEIWPDMSPKQISGLRTAFRDAGKVTLTYVITKGPEIAGDSATVSFEQQLMTHATARSLVTMTLTKQGTWRISSIR